MAQKTSSRRGRPRTHDPEAALVAAAGLFWSRGLTGTSLDDLSAAMGMNRPSIYLAFGDKEALYRKALDHFRQHLGAGLAKLERSPGLEAGLLAFFNQAIRIYVDGDQAKGCMVMCTAPAVALTHPEVREDLAGIIRDIDAAFLRRIERAGQESELLPGISPKGLAMTLQAILHSLALRARSGEPARTLRRFVREAVALCLGRASLRPIP